MSDITKMLAAVGVKSITAERFLELSEDVDLNAEMTDGGVFNASSLGHSFVVVDIEKDAETKDSIIELLQVEDQVPVMVHGFAMKETQVVVGNLADNKTAGNWFHDSKKNGVIWAFKVVKFKERKIGGNVFLPRYAYRNDVIANQFNIPLEEAEKLLEETYSDLTKVQRARRNRMMKWARKQKYADILDEDLLTKAGNPVTEIMHWRTGKILIQTVERL